MTKRLFILKDYHVDLLKHSYIIMSDNYKGGFMQYPKKPYGNSDIFSDIRNIVGDRYEGELTDSVCQKIHEEVTISLEVCLESLSFIPGAYSKNVNSRWVKM